MAAVAVSAVFARNAKQGFETDTDGFDVQGEGNESQRLEYGAAAKPSPVADLFDTAGDYFFDLDTGDATLWCTNSGDAAYFDMNMQFNPCAAAPEIEEGTKIAVYLNTSSNLVVISGPNTTTNVTGTTLEPGTWGRLTISATNDLFTVSLDGVVVGSYASLTEDASVKSIGFKGTGALDNYVARTTDPFLLNPAVTIDGEGYASIADAIADDPTATPRLETDVALSTPLAYGESISVKLNNHTLSGITTGSLVAIESTSGDVTTYTANYFPRTATAGQDGSAANPYEIADADDLVALQDAILADAANGTTFASKSYVQTANIDMTGVAGFYGIGWFKSSDSYASLPAGLASASTDVPFAGTYDGAGNTLSNVRLVRHNYAGVFNCVEGTVKNLTVENLGFVDTSAGEWGCAIVGNAQGSALLENLTSAGTVWGNNANHNVAGTVVRVQNTVTIRGCVNNAPITSVSRRLGGIVSFTGNTAPTGTIMIEGCTNNAALTVNTGSNAGDRGLGGIISRPESIADGLLIRNCANFGVLTNNGVPAKVGGIAGELNSQNYVDGGGNTFLASLSPVGNYNSKTVTGLAYALPVTIEEADYLTTVAQADLAAGNTYTLLANVAASETPVFTLTSAGDTIAFDTAKGFTFAGNVAVDTTTLVLATPVTEGTVTTYSATAGVASVDNFAYATFEGALAALEGETTDDFVTLLADVTYSVSAGNTLKVKAGTHTFTCNKVADDVVLSESTVEGITTYTAVEGVASVYHEGTTTWYATFAAAYDAAAAITTGDYPILTVKVGSDFTPTITYSQYFQQIKFVSTTEDPITVNLKNAAGTYTMTALGYQASENVTLVLPTDFTAGNEAYLTGGCTVEVPEGVTLTLAAGSSGTLANIGGLVGAGTLVAPTDALALANFIASAKYSGWLKAATWTGTLQCSGNATVVSFANIANADASLRFCGFTNYVWNATSVSSFKAIELVDDGLTLAGDTSGQNLVWTFANALKGDGTLNVAVTGNGTASYLKTIKFTGDVSGFAGDIKFTDVNYAADDVLIFGNDSSSVSKAIVVSDGVVMTNATGKTWNAPGGVVVNGELVANGTVTTTDKLYGTGVYQAASTAAITADSTWTGTYVVDWNPSDAFNPNNYGNENSVVVLAKDLATSAYFGPGTNHPLTIEPTIRLDADVTIKNGYAYTDKSYLVTFKKLTGSKKLTTFATSNANVVYYKIDSLEDFTGSLDIKAHTEIEIGNVVLAAAPTAGDLVIPVTLGAEKSDVNSPTFTVAGSSDVGTLTYDANGAEGAGLYYYAEYTVTYNLDLEGATNAVGNITAFTSQTPTFTLLDAGCDGYTFEGWTNAQGNAVTTIAGGATGDVTVYASWTKDSSGSIEPVAPEAPASTVTNAIAKVGYADEAAIKELVDGDATKYNEFVTWANNVGAADVKTSTHAAESFQLSPIVANATLFENEPTLTFTEIKPAATGSNWDVTVELKDGVTPVQLKAAVESFATRVWKGASLTTMTQCTASDVTAAVQEGGTKVKLTVTPPAGDSGFIKIKAE